MSKPALKLAAADAARLEKLEDKNLIVISGDKASKTIFLRASDGSTMSATTDNINQYNTFNRPELIVGAGEDTALAVVSEANVKAKPTPARSSSPDRDMRGAL